VFLLFDVGNTNITFTNSNSDTIHRITSRDAIKYDQLRKEIEERIERDGYHIHDITDAMVASVVPQIDKELQMALEALSIKVTFLRASDIPLSINVHTPSEVGIDRLVTAYAATKITNADIIVIDFGTATTIDLILYPKIYEGGVICPGIDLSIYTLHKYTAKLPKLSIEDLISTLPTRIIGKDTISAISSGLLHGYSAMIGSIIEQISEKYQKKCTVIATGGNCKVFQDMIPQIDIYDENLIINGLFSLYKRAC